MRNRTREQEKNWNKFVEEQLVPAIIKSRVGKKITQKMFNEKGKLLSSVVKEMEVKEMADKLDISSAHVYNMEKGKSVPSLPLLFMIAEAGGKKLKITIE